MKFTFASFAALSMTATQAAKLNKQFVTPPNAEHVQTKKDDEPMSYSNIMESVKSLEKAYEFHKNEEKLLNEINNELREYWTLSDQSHKVVQDDETLVNNKAKTEVKAKVEQKVEKPKPAPAPAAVTQTQTVKQDAFDGFAENLQLDDINYLQISENTDDAVGLQLDDMPKDLDLETILNQDPDLFAKELQQLKQGQKAHHKMKLRAHHKQKHAKMPIIQEALQNQAKQEAAQKVETKTEEKPKTTEMVKVDTKAAAETTESADLLSESKEAEAEYIKEMEAFKALQKAKANMKMKNTQLAKMKESQLLKQKEAAKAEAEVKAKEDAKLKAKADAKLKAEMDAKWKKIQERQMQQMKLDAEAMSEADIAQKAYADAEIDIKMKLRAAEQAADTAESLAKEAQREALDLSLKMDTSSTTKKHNPKEPSGYRFIQIPRYAFTTDLEESSKIEMDAAEGKWNKAKLKEAAKAKFEEAKVVGKAAAQAAVKAAQDQIAESQAAA